MRIYRPFATGICLIFPLVMLTHDGTSQAQNEKDN